MVNAFIYPPLNQEIKHTPITNGSVVGGALFSDSISLCSSGLPGTHSVGLAGLDLTEIRLVKHF